ncbi:MAG: hypothetical protein R2827_03775 [Bdellovibrionales bacterium]
MKKVGEVFSQMILGDIQPGERVKIVIAMGGAEFLGILCGPS